MPHDYTNPKQPFANATSIFVCAIIIMIVGTGCGLVDRFRESTTDSPPSSADKTETSNSETSNSSETDTSALCTNEYYPVDPALMRRYEITGPGAAKYTLTQKDVSESGFKEDRAFDSGIVVTNNWLCTHDGLRTAEFTNTGVMQSGRFEMETVKSSGVTIPRRLETGKTFDSRYDVKVKLGAGPVSVDATGDVKISNEVVSVGELIEVRGKSFDTARIDSTIEVTINVRGRKVEGAKINMSNWYGKGAGVVKQETSGTFGKQLVEIVAIENK